MKRIYSVRQWRIWRGLKQWGVWGGLGYAVLALVALAIGYVIFDTAIARTKIGSSISDRFIARPTIGIIKLDTSIFSFTRDMMVEMLRYARDSDSIKAVVLEVESPGGGVTSTEEIYLDIMRLREEKPVVASIGMGALSGAYYVAVASNYIYAKPTSFIGNVGVWITLPPEREELSEDIIPTGPFKSSGSSRRRTIAWQEMVKQGFIRTVVSGRGDKLRMSQEELSKAEIYIGMEALRYGLIDELGSTSDAIERAAAMAGITNYRVLDIEEELDLQTPFFLLSSGENPQDQGALSSFKDIVPLYYFMYRAPEVTR
ncbi:MAG: S49 family peptidase [Dehalococcoidia bacterium]